MQAQQQSPFDMGKSTFPLSVRFPAGLRNSHLSGGEGAGLKMRLGGSGEQTCRSRRSCWLFNSTCPICSWFDTGELCKALPLIQEGIIHALELLTASFPCTFCCCLEQVFAAFLSNFTLLSYGWVLLQSWKFHLSATSTYRRISYFENKAKCKIQNVYTDKNSISEGYIKS